MNIFVLSTGRCGSTTFERACRHIRNYTSAHESRISTFGPKRLNYPNNHIESDNRLSWFLGRLEESYGDQAFYVHLMRDRQETAVSYSKRLEPGLMMQAYARGVYWGLPEKIEPFVLDLALDYVDTVNTNIRTFLANKTQKMELNLETAKEDFKFFWDRIDAKGDLNAALLEWDISHNAYGMVQGNIHNFSYVSKKVTRIIAKFPTFIRDA